MTDDTEKPKLLDRWQVLKANILIEFLGQLRSALFDVSYQEYELRAKRHDEKEFTPITMPNKKTLQGVISDVLRQHLREKIKDTENGLLELGVDPK